MSDLGVRYLMVRTDAAKREAAAQERLEYVTTSGPWDVYELRNANIIEPLTVQPVVVADRGGDQRERNLELGTSWFQRREDWPAMPADDGPDQWQRISVEIDMDARIGEPGDRSRNVDYVLPAEPIEVVELPALEVTDVEIRQQSISFDVDRVGVPVLVRVSYFPNWSVEGAEGPYRVSPNHMVVIPTAETVELTYGRSTLDWFFYALTAVGIGLCVVLRRRGDVHYGSERPLFAGPPARTDAGDDLGGVGLVGEGGDLAAGFDGPATGERLPAGLGGAPAGLGDAAPTQFDDPTPIDLDGPFRPERPPPT